MLRGDSLDTCIQLSNCMRRYVSPISERKSAYRSLLDFGFKKVKIDDEAGK